VDPAWFEEVLYPLQDEVLAVMARVETGFYLTGGTALGRVHLRHRYDTPENILANKVTALLDREEPKDLADVWALCERGGLGLRDALVGAASKAVGVFAADVARVLLGATADDWRLVRWRPPSPPVDEFLRGLRGLGEDLLLVR
jgi:hypothetical protein